MLFPKKKNPVADMLLQDAAQQESARADALARQQSRYDGAWPNSLGATALDPSAADNVKVNYAKKTVNTSAFYLFGREVGFEVVTGANKPSDADPNEDSEEEVWLEKVWDDNHKMSFLLELAISGGTAGHAFVRILPPVKEGSSPRLISLDPANVSALWDARDYNNVKQWRIQWTGLDPDAAEATPVTYRDLIDLTPIGGWTITEQECRGASSVFVTTEGPMDWPFDFCPVFSCKNLPTPHQFYGMSDLEDDVLRINAAINLILSNINRILRAYGHPTTYVTGASASEIDRAVGSVVFLPNPEAQIKNVEMVSDLTSAFDQLKRLTEVYHELTSIPEVTTGKLENVGQLSGLAIQILYGPLIDLTTAKRINYGTMLRRLNLALLVMGGFEGVTDVNLQWPGITPSDPAAEANTAVALQAAGVSKDTTITGLGYNPVAEANKRKAETKETLDAQAKAFNAGPGNDEDEDKEDDKR